MDNSVISLASRRGVALALALSLVLGAGSADAGPFRVFGGAPRFGGFGRMPAGVDTRHFGRGGGFVAPSRGECGPWRPGAGECDRGYRNSFPTEGPVAGYGWDDGPPRRHPGGEQPSWGHPTQSPYPGSTWISDGPPPRHVAPNSAKPPVIGAWRAPAVPDAAPPAVQPFRRPPTPPPPPAPSSSPAVAARALPPPPGELRYRAGEVLVETPRALSQATIAPILARHRLVEVEATDLDLIGVSLRLWRIPDSRGVGAVVRDLASEGVLLRIQPNYLYRPADQASPKGAPQYSLEKLHVDPSLLASGGEPVRVAVIDTAIDETHPDLAGAVAETYDAIGGASPAHDLAHGTSIAGAIAARGRIRGVAPNVQILSARAFDGDGKDNALGSTKSICKGIDWAVTKQARVVNMSFAGPPDPLLHDAIERAFDKGLTLIGAAGNSGRYSPPLYPAAEPRVIAITATDEDDNLYDMANVGSYVALSAPGVDVMLPTPKGGHATATGTSVSAALVSGVVALMLEHRATLTPDDVRKKLMSTAAPLGAAGHAADFGAGLVDARKAVAGP